MAIESLWRFYVDYGRRDLRELERAVADLNKGKVTRERRIVLARLFAPLGRFYGDRGDRTRAKQMLEESLVLLRTHDAIEESLVPLLYLADVQDSLEDSNQLYLEGLALAREIDDPWAIGHAHLYLGWNAGLAGNYPEAQKYLYEALKQFRKNGDEGGIVTTLQTMANVSIDRGLYEEALAHAQEANSIAIGFNPMFRMMGVRSLGRALHALNRYEEAEALFQQGLTASREFGRENLTEDLHYWLGQIAFQKQNYALAAQRFQTSLAGSVERSYQELVVHNHNALGRLDLAQDRWLSARERFREALQLATGLKQRPLILDCIANIADLHIGADNLDEATPLLSLVLEHPASRAKLRERITHQANHMPIDLSSDKVDNIRRHQVRSDLFQVAEQLLQDLENT